MAHLCDDAARLEITPIMLASSMARRARPEAALHSGRSRCRLAELAVSDAEPPAVWLLVLPDGWTGCPSLVEDLRRFAARLHHDSVVALLTRPIEACEGWLALEQHLHFQLWVAVKLRQPLDRGPTRLPEHHAALLILSRYRGSLRHAKTRIAYSYCPACDRTTKDYGGKKHTYHASGTLISDVWRDIFWEPNQDPDEIAVRLADLFGLAPYRRLWYATFAAAAAPPRQIPEPAPDERDRHSSIRSRLIQGDCLKALAAIADDSIDFRFADPPYNLDKKYDRCDDALAVAEYFRWCDGWLDELARVLRPGRTCAVLNIPLWAIRHHAHLGKRLSFQSWLVWEGLSLPVRMIMPAHYAIVCFSKGAPRPLPGLGPAPLQALAEWYCSRTTCVGQRRRARCVDQVPISDLWWDIHRLKHNSRRVDHPCQLPPRLMRRLIELFTHPGEAVLDPFNGCGTSTLCAAALDRRYVGIELSQEYHEAALARHELLAAGGDPFAKERRPLRAKNSRVRRMGTARYAVSKKTLQLEVKRIAAELGRMPTRPEVAGRTDYPMQYFDDYFISWAEACAAARTTGMVESRPS